MIQELSKVENLETAIDLRMIHLISGASEIEDCDGWDWEAILSYLRCAYTNGYYDALAEKQRGELCLETGYRVPQRGDRG
jgi:hypothetical protein